MCRIHELEMTICRLIIAVGVLAIGAALLWGWPIARAEGFCHVFELRGLIPGSRAPLPVCGHAGVDWERHEFKLPAGAPGYIPQPPMAPGAVWFIDPQGRRGI
jgi:hypothetical protein